MQRLTARLLLLFALLGTFLPIALQATSAPLHACCRRQGSHHCLDFTGATDEPVARDARCCIHDCSRAVTTPHWAHAESPSTSVFLLNVTVGETDQERNAPASAIFSFRCTRAPPQLPIA